MYLNSRLQILWIWLRPKVCHSVKSKENGISKCLGKEENATHYYTGKKYFVHFS